MQVTLLLLVEPEQWHRPLQKSRVKTLTPTVFLADTSPLVYATSVETTSVLLVVVTYIHLDVADIKFTIIMPN